MDDVSWDEPTPRRRRVDANSTPRRRVQADVGFTVELADPQPVEEPGFFDEDRASVEDARAARPRITASSRPDRAALAAGPVIELDTGLDEEEIWGPRPKLMADEAGGRRTVVITGRVADRYVTPHRQRGGQHSPLSRFGLKADRTAMWAVMLGLMLLLVAITSGH
jgi:hypothetical protein